MLKCLKQCYCPDWNNLNVEMFKSVTALNYETTCVTHTHTDTAFYRLGHVLFHINVSFILSTMIYIKAKQNEKLDNELMDAFLFCLLRFAVVFTDSR